MIQPVLVSVDGFAAYPKVIQKLFAIKDRSRRGPPKRVPWPKLWTPETPELYELAIEVSRDSGEADRVKSYFGLRTVGRGPYGGQPYESILLNGEPVKGLQAVRFPVTGAWTAFEKTGLPHPLLMRQGENKVRFEYVSGHLNFKSLEFIPVIAPTPTGE